MDSGSSSSDTVEPQFNVVVLGNGAVGKTSLIQRFCEDDFGPSYKQTIGLDFYSKRVEIPLRAQTVTLRIWDIGGQQIGGNMLTHYIQNADAVCYVYDVTNQSSLKDVEDWYEAVLATFQNKAMPYMVLVGNKEDLPNRQVSAEFHEKAASSYGMYSCLVSARSGEKVNELFTKIAAKLSGHILTSDEFGGVDRVVANIESNPQERVSVLQTALPNNGRKNRKENDDNCVLM